MMNTNKLSLLSSRARIQIPWVKVTLKSKTGDFTFGVFTEQTKSKYKNSKGFWYKDVYGVSYPNYIQSLSITKINGQVNKYTLNISYPVTQNDDPNFFDKILGAVGTERKIIFSYGDASTPAFIYKNEEAVITTVTQSFNLPSTVIDYTISAISGAALDTPECLSFGACTAKPSTKIKEVFDTYKLNKTFTGMSNKNWDNLIARDDAEVKISAKTNISALDYILYLVSCMYPITNSTKIDPKSIYILTIHDASIYDASYTYNENFGDIINKDITNSTLEIDGPYFKIAKVSYDIDNSDAYTIDIGYNTAAIVTSFSIENNESYAIYYEHQMELSRDTYVRRLNDEGKWEDVYAPTVSSKNTSYLTKASDQTWWTKITQFPISASITIQGLLRPAKLLTYVRLNVIFPGGHRHNSSGLYIITKQTDTIDGNGYKTTLSLTRVGGAGIKTTGTTTITGNGNTNFTVEGI